MPQDSPIAAAKGALSKAKGFTASVAKQAGGPMPAKATAAKATPPPAKPATATPGEYSTLGSELAEKRKNVDAYAAAFPNMHTGGIIPEDGLYNMKKGEKVTPVAEGGSNEGAAKAGRQSEYRKVFIGRRQARSGGGNKPVTDSAEKHDQKKAQKSGQPNAKKAGGHVESE